MPEGTRYFAIRYVGNDDNFMFLVDNIRYSSGVMKVLGYRIYRGTELVAETAADVHAYEVPKSDVPYYVTVCYGNGESGFSNPASDASGILQLEVGEEESNWYDVFGHRVDCRNAGKGIFISSDGRKIVK